MAQEANRHSGIEALRIVAMLMIIAHHLSIHGVMHYTSETEHFKIWIMGSVINKMITAMMFPFGAIGVAVYFIITGYYCFNKENAYKRLKKVALETMFYGFLFLLIFLITKYTSIIDYGEIKTGEIIKEQVKSVIAPLSSGAYWFVTSYAILILFIPVLNNFLRHCTKKEFLFLLLIGDILWYTLAEKWSDYFALYRAPFFYSIGAFISHYCQLKKDEKYNKKHGLYHILSGSVFFIAILTGMGLAYTNISYMAYETNQVLVKLTTMIITGIVVPVASIALFFLFRDIDIQSKVINRISCSTFGVYLIHDSMVGRYIIWRHLVKPDITIFHMSLFPFYAIAITMAVFAVCTTVDLFRRLFVEKQYINMMDSIFNTFRVKLNG